MVKVIDLTGNKYGRLTVVSMVGRKYTKGGYPYYAWECICDCGNRYVANGCSLKTGSTKSCGCITKEKRAIGDLTKTHGLSKTKLYNCWQNMKKRCDKKNASCYEDYGGRGITYCEEWKSFESFRDWAFENGYKETLTLDRINVDGNYCPENCRWVDAFTQANNTRRNHYISYGGEKYTAAELARLFNVNYHTFLSRIQRGVPVEDCLKEKLQSPKYGQIEYNGEVHTYAEWARITGIKKTTIRYRIVEKGMSPKEALTTPVKK